jgi:hypothetical protein
MSHLKLVKENYFKHMIEAWFIILVLLYASLSCFIHSIFPFLFTKTASSSMIYILERTEKRSQR